MVVLHVLDLADSIDASPSGIAISSHGATEKVAQ
jgi:hypothetical protein